MLWIALHFPELPLQVFLRGPALELLAVAEGRVLLAANEAARRLGVRPGMSLATAAALAPGLAVRARHPRLEAAALEEVAAWAGQFTPNVSLDPPEGLLLDVEASLRLFGGVRRLSLQLAKGVDALGFNAALAAAPTPAGARLLARAGGHARLRHTDELEAALAPLPVQLLDGAPQVQEALAAFGALTIGDCLHLPRAGLARRCGQELVQALDRALGRMPDPREWFVPPRKYSARLELPAAVEHAEAVLFAARRLLAGLAGFLAARHAGIERLQLTLVHEDAPATQLPLAFAGATCEEARFTTVLRERLAALRLPAPVAALVLEADELRPLAPTSRTLFGDAHTQRESCAQLLERLRARLGHDAVTGVRAVPAHRPELAWESAEPGTKQRLESLCGTRPLWLLDPPQSLPSPACGGGAGGEGKLTLLAGPERIESGWWDGRDAARDYFIAQGEEGELLWLFRERRPPHGWYVQGLFA